MLKQIFSSRKDRHLVRSFLDRRDEQAFHVLYERYTPALYQFTLRMVGWCPQDAEDVVQDTWVRAVERLSEFRWQSAFKTWLTAIAINRSRELLRRKARKTGEDVPPESVPPPHIEQHIDVERAIAALPNGYRMVLVLHDFEGYKHEEIGRLLDVDPGTSKSQLYHARRAVRRALQEPETQPAHSEKQA